MPHGSRLLLPVIILDSIIAIAKKQPPQPAPVLALGWVPFKLYREFCWGVQFKPATRRRSWSVDHFLFGIVPVIVPGGCMVWTNAPTIELIGRSLIERRLRFR